MASNKGVALSSRKERDDAGNLHLFLNFRLLFK